MLGNKLFGKKYAAFNRQTRGDFRKVFDSAMAGDAEKSIKLLRKMRFAKEAAFAAAAREMADSLVLVFEVFARAMAETKDLPAALNKTLESLELGEEATLIMRAQLSEMLPKFTQARASYDEAVAAAPLSTDAPR